MKKIFYILLLLIFSNLAWTQIAEKTTLGITKITAIKSLEQKMSADRTTNTLSRVLESLDSNLTSEIHATRKFEVVSRSDMDAISKEISFGESGNVILDKNAPKSGMLKGAKYILVVTVNDFQDYIAKAKFATIGKNAEKRIIRFGAVAKLINSSTGAIVETTNFTISNNDISEESLSVTESSKLNDSLINDISNAMAKKIAVRVSDIVYPIKILAKTGSVITINRGDGTGIKAGDEYEIFAIGETIIDPDTGENLGAEEILIGKAKVTRVNPKMSQAQITQDSGIEKGQILRAVKKIENEE